MNKKLLIFALVTLLSLLIIIAIFVFFYFNKKEVEPTYYPVEEVKIINNKDDGTIDSYNKVITSEDNQNENIDILDKQINKAQIVNNNIYFYTRNNDNFYKLKINDGVYEETKILISKFPSITDMQVANSEKYLLYQEASTGKYFIYNLEAGTKNKTNDFIESAYWYPGDDNKLIGSYSSMNKNNINFYYWKEKKREEITDLSINNGVLFDVSLNGNYLLYSRNETWLPDKEEIITENVEPNEALDNKLVIFDIKDKKVLLQSDVINNARFSKDSNYMLSSRLSSSGYPRIALMDIKTQKEKPLNLGTYFNKIEFTNDPNILIYAKIENFNGAFTKDTLWKFNITNGQKTQLTKLDNDNLVDISNIMISSDNKNVYFINKYDKKLYQVAIE